VSWAPLVGHREVLDRIANAIARGRLGHAFLFVGPSGIGKKRAARQLAQGLLCERRTDLSIDPCGHCPGCAQVEAGSHPDFFEVGKPADKHEFPIKVIQDLCASLSLKPARGGKKIAIIDDADWFNEESANCFLKTLEEPPPNSLLMLMATNMETQLPTIVSRCQVVRFTELTSTEVANLLLRLGTVTDREEATALAGWSGGSVGRAIELATPQWRAIRERLLEGLLQLPGKALTLAKELQAFIDSGNPDSVTKRNRSRRLIGLAVDFFSEALRVGAGVQEPLAGELKSPSAQMAARLGEQTILDLIDRCLAADYHIERFLSQSLAMECWMDDLAQIRAGRYVPAIK